MSTKEWLENICIRGREGKEPHLHCLVNPHKANGIKIATIFEDESGVDTPQLPENGRGQIRFVVLNESHRDCFVSFNSKATRDALSFHGANTGTCEVTAEWIDDKAVQFPMYEILSVQVREGTTKAQEVFATAPLLRLIPKKPKPVEDKQLPVMRNIVSIRPPSYTEAVTSKGEKAMPKNYLKAIGEGVAALAGPAGAPLKVLLSLYSDELKDKEGQKNEELQKLLESSKQIRQEELEVIFEVRQDMVETRRLLVELLTPLLEQVRLSTSKQPEAIIPAANRLRLPGPLAEITDEDSLVDELRNLFGTDTRLFISLLPNNFPTETFNSNEAGVVVFKSFTRACRGLDSQLLCNTFNKLSREKPSSQVFKKLSSIHCEAAAVEKQ